MRILIEPSLLHCHVSKLPKETQDEIHALRLFATELVNQGDLAFAQIALTFADMLEDGMTWDQFLDDIPVFGAFRQHQSLAPIQ